MLPQIRTDAFERTACAICEEEMIEPLAWAKNRTQGLQQLWACCALVDGGVGLIRELVRVKPVMLRRQFLCFDDHTRALVCRVCQDNLCACTHTQEREHRLTSLLVHEKARTCVLITVVGQSTRLGSLVSSKNLCRGISNRESA